jgi:hypothetical protein
MSIELINAWFLLHNKMIVMEALMGQGKRGRKCAY